MYKITNIQIYKCTNEKVDDSKHFIDGRIYIEI